MRPVELEKPQGPMVPADVKMAAAAAAVGNVVLRDVNGLYLLIQASSPVHVPILVFAKIRQPAFEEAGDPEEGLWGSPLVADILDALSLRGPADAFEGVRGHLFGGLADAKQFVSFFSGDGTAL